MRSSLASVFVLLTVTGYASSTFASADLALVSACSVAKGDESSAACTQEISDKNTAKDELPLAYYNRGAAYVNKDVPSKADLRKALADFTVAISLQPDLGAAFYARGNTYEALGNIKQAASDLARAAVLNQ